VEDILGELKWAFATTSSPRIGIHRAATDGHVITGEFVEVVTLAFGFLV
jgi:hypothetical protein